MHVRTGRLRRLRTGRTALLLIPVAALAIACGPAAGSSSAGGSGGGTGSGSGGGTGGDTSGTGAAASCAYVTQPDYLKQARVVFVATMLPGRTIDGPDGLLV